MRLKFFICNFLRIATAVTVPPPCEINRFLRVTSSAGHLADFLLPRKTNASRFLSIVKVAQAVFSVEASSSASESMLSTFRKLIDPCRSTLSDESITFIILLKFWVTF